MPFKDPGHEQPWHWRISRRSIFQKDQVYDAVSSVSHVSARKISMPQSHPATGPVRFLSPAGFLARKAEWSARRNFTSVLFPWSHQATGPVRLDTPAYCWFGRIIRRTPRVPRTISYGPHTGIFYVFHILRYPCGARAWPARVPYGCLQSQNPYGARKLIMHALKLYGPRTGRRNSYGAARGP